MVAYSRHRVPQRQVSDRICSPLRLQLSVSSLSVVSSLPLWALRQNVVRHQEGWARRMVLSRVPSAVLLVCSVANLNFQQDSGGEAKCVHLPG